MNKSYPVILIKLPFTSVLNTPSLGLSILKAANQNAGISTLVIESEIEFAHRIGTDLFADLVWPNTEILFFDSLFASVMDRESPIDETYFLEKFKKSSLSGPRSEIAKKYSFLNDVSNKGDYLFRLFKFLRPLCEKFIEDVAIKILTLEPIIVGATTTTEQTMASLALFSRLKQKRPELVTVMGGFNCEGYAGRVLVKNFTCLDVAFSGEAEKQFPEFCRDVLKNGLDTAISNQPDQMWNKFNVHRPKEQLPPIRLSIDTLDESPVPDFDDYIQQLYEKDCQALAHVVFPFVASRGCWWGEKFQCTFCGLSDDVLKYKSKSPEKMLSEIKTLKNKYNARRFVAADLAFPFHYHQTFIPELTRECQGQISVYYQVKSNMSFKEVTNLKLAGIDNVQPGIESFDNEELCNMNKGVSGIQNLAFIKYCTINEMTVSWNLLYDRHITPNEKLVKLDQNLLSFIHLYPPYTIRPLNYPKDSVFFKEQDKRGLKLIPHPLYEKIYKLDSKEDIEDLAYCYLDITPPRNYHDPQVISSLMKKWSDWKNKFHSNQASLTYRIDNEVIVIVDTRPEQPIVHHLEADVLSLLDATFSPVSLTDLKSKVSEKNYKLIDWMIDNKLFYRDRDKILNLVLEAKR